MSPRTGREKFPGRQFEDRKSLPTYEALAMEERNEIDALIRQIDRGPLEARRAAVRRLAAIGPSAVEPLLTALDGARENDIRWYYAAALARIGEPAIGRILIAMRGGRKKEFLDYASAALGAIGEPAVEPVIDAMKDADPVLRGYLSMALCRIGEPALGPLKKRLTDSDEVVRQCASLTLWKMGEGGISAMVERYHVSRDPPAGPGQGDGENSSR
jgi:HEAT repeat protein